jgi:hypothetical protein
MILDHWKQHLRQTVEDLRAMEVLPSVLKTAELLTAELLYDLIVVKKMDYLDAWEMATREWAFLPTEAPQSTSIQR